MSEDGDISNDAQTGQQKAARQIRFDRWPAVKRALINNLPGFQALHKSGAAEKREWRKKTLETIVKECPDDMTQEFGLAKIRKVSPGFDHTCIHPCL